MSHQPQESLTPKQQALHDLEEARGALAHHAGHVAEEWNPKAIVTRSVQKHRAVWLGAAVIAGAAVLKLVWPSGGAGHRHEPYLSESKSRGLLALLLSPLIGLARKSIMHYGTQWVENYLQSKVSPNEQDSQAV